MTQMFEPLTEELRHSYLQAMDITLWVPKDEPPIEFDSLPGEVVGTINRVDTNRADTNTVDTNTVDISRTPNNERVKNTEVSNESKVQVPLEVIDTDPQLVNTLPEKIASGIDTAIEEIKTKEVKQDASEQIPAAKNTIKPSSYLKLVNWRSSNQGDKSLLVICRHDKNQPAQSFARPNAPSQFMHDYLQAFTMLLNNVGIEVQIQLAHLTEAGLGSDNQPMPETISTMAPDLILLLGDESIHHLFDVNSDVAAYRGKLLEIKQLAGYSKSKTIASYHPFTLIENPQLKKLAFEDLGFVADFIKNSNP